MMEGSGEEDSCICSAIETKYRLLCVIWDSLNVIESCILLYPRQRLLPHSLVTMRRDADTATLLPAPHALVKLLPPKSDEIFHPTSTVPWANTLFQVLKPGCVT